MVTAPSVLVPSTSAQSAWLQHHQHCCVGARCSTISTAAAPSNIACTLAVLLQRLSALVQPLLALQTHAVAASSAPSALHSLSHNRWRHCSFVGAAALVPACSLRQRCWCRRSLVGIVAVPLVPPSIFQHSLCACSTAAAPTIPVQPLPVLLTASSANLRLCSPYQHWKHRYCTAGTAAASPNTERTLAALLQHCQHRCSLR
jgi:hypothetical protein